ncbi:uncharacterized protein LOC141704115 [Apium graveolens]|uniref:uncharacterized protein LOC141704115 n=1 Tax=Apium graveolens TaxID=4045 RepID=UPI003D7B1C34
MWAFIIFSVNYGVGSSGSPRAISSLGSDLGTTALLDIGPSRSIIGGGSLRLGGGRGLGVGCKGGFMTLKLNTSKAYDRVEWDFLRAILLKMVFHKKWVNLIMQTVITVLYTNFHGLSALIRRNEAQKLMSDIKVWNHAPSITHMFFADNGYLFCKANVEEVQNVLNMLKIFEGASRQKINTSKSSVFFSTNMGNSGKTLICDTLQMQKADDRSTYQGLSNILGRNKSTILGFLKDKVTKRVETWDGKIISKPGKEILIKSVAQTILSYAVSVFLLPLEITKDIERTISKYCWSSKSDGSRGYFVCVENDYISINRLGALALEISEILTWLYLEKSGGVSSLTKQFGQ